MKERQPVRPLRAAALRLEFDCARLLVAPAGSLRSSARARHRGYWVEVDSLALDRLLAPA
jgi:hypothetical protein